MYNERIQSMTGTEVSLNVDVCVLNDNLSIETVKKLREKICFSAEKTVIVIDQIVPPNSPESSAVQRQLMKLSDEQKIPLYYGRMMTSQYLNQTVKDGDVVVAKNDTVITAGIQGALGICVTEEQLEEVFQSGTITVTLPETVSVKLSGCAEDGCLKQAVLQLAKDVDVSVWSEKLVIVDKNELSKYSESDQLGFFTLLRRYGCFSAIAKEKEIDVTEKKEVLLETDSAKTIAAFGNGFSNVCCLDEVEPKSVKVVFIGGSTGGTFEAIETLAKMVKGKKIAYGLRLSVAPATAEIYAAISEAGYIADIMDAGGLVLNQCADPEIQCRVGMNEVMVSNDWKNIAGYAGYDSSEVILTDTKTAVEAALTGVIGTYRSLDKKPLEEDKEEPIVCEGRCWKFGDDIDTDIIIPTQWVCVPMEEMKHHAFEPLRPELADALKDGDILVAGDNFGCGSSREMAAEVIKENGVRCIIAKSFARIFFRNAINNGILLIECPELPEAVEEGDIIRVELNRQIICNGKSFPIGKIQKNLYDIIADGGLVKNIEKKVKNGEL